MHFSITAAFGGRLATLLKLAQQSQQPAAETGHMSLLVAIFFSSSAKGLATSSPSNTRRTKLASVSKGARLARTCRRSSRKSSVFEPAIAWSSRVFISVVSSAPHAPKMANAWLCSMRPTPLHLALNVSSSPAPSRKRVRTLPQLTNAGCAVHTWS